MSAITSSSRRILAVLAFATVLGSAAATTAVTASGAQPGSATTYTTAHSVPATAHLLAEGTASPAGTPWG